MPTLSKSTKLPVVPFGRIPKCADLPNFNSHLQLFIIFQSTVKPVYKNHPWDPKKVAVVHRWSFCRGFSIKIGIKISKLAQPDLVWPLLTGGCCSEVAVNTGLTVLAKIASLNLHASSHCLTKAQKRKIFLNLSSFQLLYSQVKFNGFWMDVIQKQQKMRLQLQISKQGQHIIK